MPKYLAKVSYTPEGLAGLRKAGAVARVKMGEAAVASVGGTQECMYFAFGDDDVIAILDLPDDEAAAALSLVIGASGSATGTTTKLLTAEQVDEAFRRTVDYRPPGT
ncbi:MAG: hypothetical protein QOJ19_3807 [Acidimicrobiia bacterium]|jgi:uncharacterized protein with GYD domain|nr:hypothetical protein [Acidimicrobiia bacterium]